MEHTVLLTSDHIDMGSQTRNRRNRAFRPESHAVQAPRAAFAKWFSPWAVPACADQCLGLGCIQNVIQAISRNPRFHEDLACVTTHRSTSRVLRNCSAAKLSW